MTGPESKKAPSFPAEPRLGIGSSCRNQRNKTLRGPPVRVVVVVVAVMTAKAFMGRDIVDPARNAKGRYGSETFEGWATAPAARDAAGRAAAENPLDGGGRPIQRKITTASRRW